MTRRPRSQAGRTGLAALMLACLVPVAQAGEPARGGGPIETLLVEGTSRGFAAEVTRAERVPGAVSVVDLMDLEQRSVSSIADMLRYVPGMWVSSDAGSEDAFFSSRGSNLDATDYDQNGVKLLQDGLPVTTADGNNHNRVIDPLSAQYATVARGANALAYGASTLGGAINFVSPTGRDRHPLELRLDAGSHGLAAGRATLAGTAGEAVDGLLTLEARSWDGYRDHNRQKRRGAYGNVGVNVADDVVTRFYGTWLDNDQALPGALSEAELEDDPDQAGAGAVGGNFQLNVDSRRIANKTTWAPTASRRVELGVSWEEQQLFHPIVDKVLVDFDGTEGPAEAVEVFSLLIDTDHRDLGALARLQQQVGDHELVVGVNYGENVVNGGHYRNDRGRRNGLTERIENGAETLEAFVLDRWDVTPRLSLTLAAQGVWAERRVRAERVADGAVTATSEHYATVDPRAGVVFQWAEDVSAYANVSRLYEPPTNFELQDDAQPGGEALDAMHGTVVEVGIRGGGALGQSGSWYWDTAVYYAWIRDEILSVEDPSAPGTSLVTNVDDTVHAGLEALIGAEWFVGHGHVIEPLVSVTVNRFRFDDDPGYGDNHLPAAPSYAARGEVTYRHPSGFHVGPTFDLVGRRYADFSNTYEVDAYGLLGLRGGWQRAALHVFVEVRNLLDEEYVSTHSVRNVADASAQILNPGAPLSVYAGLVLSF